MSITIQNIPFFCLLWIGIGFIFILAGILFMASHSESGNHYVAFTPEKQSNLYDKDVSEIFSYFLEEEEKKNQDLREMLLEAVNEKKENKQTLNQVISKDTNVSVNTPYHQYPIERVNASEADNQHKVAQPSGYNEIIKLYEEGIAIEEIAKKLKKGVGEVNLMISLYTMR